MSQVRVRVHSSQVDSWLLVKLVTVYVMIMLPERCDRHAEKYDWIDLFSFLYCQSQRFYVKQNHFFFSSSSLQASDVGRGDDDDGGSHPDISASEDEVKQCSWPGKQTNLGDISHTSESCHPKERFNFLKVQKKLHQQPSTFSKPNFAFSKFRNPVDHNKKCGEFV